MMRLQILLTLFLAVTSVCAVEPVCPLAGLGAGTHEPRELTLAFPSVRTFAVHSDYVSIEFPYPPFQHLFRQVNESRLTQGKLPLNSRGEAHLTLLRPAEIKELQKVLTEADWKSLPALAEELGVAKAPLEVVTVGVSRARIQTPAGSTVDAETVYLVVKSEGAGAFRNKVSELAQRRRREAGRSPAFTFEPNAHAPHITLGFTHRDLHEADGVDKTKPDETLPLIVRP